MDDRFAQTLIEVVRIFKAGKDSTVERKARLFDDLGSILSECFSDQEGATMRSVPIEQLELLSVMSSWEEKVVDVA